jgi:UDP-GlcNAc:undecaprenyl-phosphate/decaprenyl-phosphate GlcNAc-1-phosphate transferase
MIPLSSVIITIIGAFILTALITPIIIRTARTYDWVAKPKHDRWHKTSTALLGGVGMYAAVTLVLLIVMKGDFPLVVWSGGTLLFLTGLVDDISGIRPTTKLFVQIIAASMLIFSGLHLGSNLPFWAALPFTFLWVIGITNAINLIDGMDGLAAGIVVIAAAVLMVLSFLSGNIASALLAVSLVGSGLGFLIYNFKPAKIFMGDCGSLFLGFTVAALSIQVNHSMRISSMLAVLLVPAAVMAVPIFDTTLVALQRILMGRKITEGGNDHTMHRMVRLGLSERQAVLTLYGVSILFGIFAILFQFMQIQLFYSIIILSSVGLIVFGLYMSNLEVSNAKSNGQNGMNGSGSYVILRSMLHNKLQMGAMIAYILVIIGSYIMAHYLRFESDMSDVQVSMIQLSIPVVVFAKISMFFTFRIHRGIWEFAGTPDAVRIFTASTAGSILSYSLVYLIIGANYISLVVILNDWMITTAGIAVLRFGYRGFHHSFLRLQNSGKHVLIYGANDIGFLRLREILINPDLEYAPIGFIDDNGYLNGKNIQGYPVYSTLDEIVPLLNEGKVDEILIATNEIGKSQLEYLIHLCKTYKVLCRKFHVTLEPFKFESSQMKSSELVNYQ